MAQRVAPKAVRFDDLLPLGVKGVAKARNFQPNNGATFSSTNNIIRIPLNSTGFLDGQHSYLSMTVTFNSPAGGTQTYDGGPQSLIRQLRIEGSDGSELERVDNYNVIHAAMSDLQQSNDHATSVTDVLGFYLNGGAGLPTAVAAGTSLDVSMKLMSGLLNNTKYLPVGWCAGGGCVLELTLDSDAVALYQTAGQTDATYTVTNVNYVAQMVETSADFNNAFSAMLQEQGGIQYHGQTWRGHTYSIAGGSTQAVVPVSERSKSIKSIFTIMRENAQFTINDATLSQRCKFDMNSLQYKIGSNVYPAQPIRSQTDIYAELLKAVGPLGDTRSATRFDLENWTSFVYNTPPTANPSISFVGLDLETYAGSTDILESGLDTATQSLSIDTLMSWATAIPAGQVRVNTFALVDCIFTLSSDGLLTASM